MDKEFWRGFLRFLDEANQAEIQRRLDDTRKLLDRGIQNPEVRSDARRIIRFLEQELVVRQSNRE